MELCKGIQDWLECLNCPYLCTKSCPIESDNAIEEIQKQLYGHARNKPDEQGKPFIQQRNQR
jgi:hypothetical protein